jgi:hypothetical protein
MKLNIGDYTIKTDAYQFIVLKKKVVQENNKLAKEDNIGKDYLVPIGYCTSLDSALKLIVDKVLLDNDDLKTIRNELNKIYLQIKELSKALDVRSELK